VDSGAVEREAQEAAQAAAKAAAEVNNEVRIAEAQVSSNTGQPRLPAGAPIPPSAVLGESAQDRQAERG
jgi:hypothetical protein